MIVAAIIFGLVLGAYAAGCIITQAALRSRYYLVRRTPYRDALAAVASLRDQEDQAR